MDDPRADDSSDRLLAGIVAASGDAIISETLDGIIQTWNDGAERLFGYRAAEAVGQPITLIIPPELHGEERTILARLRRGERVEHFDTVRVAKDGRRIDVSLTVSPVRDQAGRVIGASKIARDISDRKRTEQALRDSDRRKDAFLATLAHELRNPLAPIRNSLEILKRAGDDPQAARRAHETMERQLAHLVRLVDDLLDLSRITRDKLELRTQRIDLVTVVRQAVEGAHAAVEQAGQTIELHAPDGPMWLAADPVRLAQVFSNLLDNASKYTEAGGAIRVSVAREGADVVVAVRDTGVGIPPAALDGIFEMFAQVDRAPAHAQGGLGIGLTLVRRLVELHGGSVVARSEGVGRGSELVVRLPVGDGAQDEEVAEADEPTLARLKLLVVDDNADSAETLAMLLGVSGHDTRVAFDGAEALAVADEYRPDVILLDVGLPTLSGLDVCRRIRQQPWGRGVVIVAITGWGQDDDRDRTAAAGFDGHLVKPVAYDAVMTLLDQLLAARRG